MIPPFSGRCLCGAVRYACEAAAIWQTLCHCESCRRAGSAPFTAFFAVRDGAWRWTGAAPAAYRSSPGVTRLFCGVCGSPMGYRNDRESAGEMHLHAVSLDDPAIFHPTMQDFPEERLTWVHPTDDLPSR